MSEQANPNLQPFPPRQGRDADIIPFQLRESEVLDPNRITADRCVSFFIHKWNDLNFYDGPIAPLIIADAGKSDEADERQDFLRTMVEKSPLFDHYDELLEVDPVTKRLSLLLSRDLPAQGGKEGITEQRKAALVLLDLRGAQVIQHPDQPLDNENEITLGDEALWDALANRLVAKP